MKQKILEAIFAVWRESESYPKEYPEVQQAMDSISDHFHAAWKDKLFVETEIMTVACAAERAAFWNGLILGIKLASGRLFDGEEPERTEMPLWR